MTHDHGVDPRGRAGGHQRQYPPAHLLRLGLGIVFKGQKIQPGLFFVAAKGQPGGLPSAKILAAVNLAHRDIVEAEGMADMRGLMPAGLAQDALGGPIVDIGLDLIGVIALGGGVAYVNHQPALAQLPDQVCKGQIGHGRARIFRSEQSIGEQQYGGKKKNMHPHVGSP